MIKKGPTNLDKPFTAPPFSPIFIIPIHKHKIPVNPSAISNEVVANNVLEIMAEKHHNHEENVLNNATKKAIKKNPIHM